jgi:hypothetical protein
VDYNGSYNGLAFGPFTPFPILEPKGLEDLPPVRSSDQPKSTDHGSFMGVDLSDERTVDITFRLAATDGLYTTLDSLIAQLQAATPVNAANAPLYFDGSSRLINARVRKREVPRKVDMVGLVSEVAVEWVAADPRVYDATLQQIVVPLPSSGSGITFPIVFPAVFGTAGTGGQINLTNTGTFPTPWVAQIQGPVINPVITNLTTGQYLSLAISLAQTDTLVIDFGARTITLNQTASRRGAMQPGSSWWLIPPGTTQCRWFSNSYSSGTLLALMRSAWI